MKWVPGALLLSQGGFLGAGGPGGVVAWRFRKDLKEGSDLGL